MWALPVPKMRTTVSMAQKIFVSEQSNAGERVEAETTLESTRRFASVVVGM
jgi:hypothetical protein